MNNSLEHKIAKIANELVSEKSDSFFKFFCKHKTDILTRIGKTLKGTGIEISFCNALSVAAEKRLNTYTEICEPSGQIKLF